MESKQIKKKNEMGKIDCGKQAHKTKQKKRSIID